MSYKYVVLAMDTLIGSPDTLDPEPNAPKIAENLIIPSNYLDFFYSNYNEQSNSGDSSKECMKILDKHMKENGNNQNFKLNNGSILQIKKLGKEFLSGLNPNSAGHQAIALAKSIKKESQKEAAVMTGSSRLKPVVRHHNIEVVEIIQELYTGRRRLDLPYEPSNEWYSNHKISADLFSQIFPEESPLRANEFVEFQSGAEYNVGNNFEYIGRLDPYKEELVPLKRFQNLPYGIRPRNSGQAMLAEALMTPPDEMPIVIVPGNFGTGKTFLTLAAGLVQTEGNGHKAIYDKIFICPRDSFLGREHGYLPGELNDKLGPLISPIKDQFREILKKRGPNASKYKKKNKDLDNTLNGDSYSREIEFYLTESGLFEIEALLYMGGRSINGSFIIFDEFQDMERGQAKALLSRIGNGSKMVIMGDPSQFTNPHLSKNSNGLSYAASIFSNYEGAAVVTMLSSETERSVAAKAISAVFDSNQ